MEKKKIVLELISGDKAGTRFCLTGKVVVLGRSRDVDIPFPDEKSLSRKHSEISLRSGKIWITDLDSQNGTFVEQERVKERELVSGNVIRLGQVSLRLTVKTGNSSINNNKANRLAVVPVASGGDGYAVSGNDALERQLPDSTPERGGTGFVWKFVVFLVLVAAALYFIDWANQPGVESGPGHYIIKRRARLVLMLPGAAKGYTKDNVSIVSSRGDEVVSWKPYRGFIAGEYTSNIIVLEGRAQGDARVTINRNGTATEINVHIRGIIPREWDENTISPEEAERLGKRKLEEADILKRRQPYAAMQRLEAASELFLKAGDGLKSEKIQQDKKNLERVLKRKVAKFYAEARAKIKGGPGQPRNFAVARSMLQEIKQLLPDQNNVDWQLANIVEQMITR